MSVIESIQGVYKPRTIIMENNNIQILSRGDWEEDWDGIIREVRRNSGECGVTELEKGEYFEKQISY